MVGLFVSFWVVLFGFLVFWFGFGSFYGICQLLILEMFCRNRYTCLV